jgi:hypothetical protein
MASDEVKIEPTLILKDVPSIASGETPEATKPSATLQADAKADEPLIEAPKPEAPKIEMPQLEMPRPEALPRAPQLAEPAPTVIPLKTAEPVAAPQPRSNRFALLAASVAIAASFGAVGGSLGVAKFSPAFTAAPPAIAPIKEPVADEVKALKETVAQLRATTKSLSDNFAALKTSVASASAQNGKIAETLERLERGQAEHRKAQAAPETTGSVAQTKQVLGDPPTTLKHPIVQGWVLRRVYDGAALIEGREGVIEVEPGSIAPGLGRIDAIKRQDGRWVVVTARGLVVGR